MKKGRKPKTALENSTLKSDTSEIATSIYADFSVFKGSPDYLTTDASGNETSGKITIKDTQLYYIVNSNNETNNKTYLKVYVYYNRFIADKTSADTFNKYQSELIITKLSEYQSELNLSIEKV